MLFMIGALAFITGCASNSDIAKLHDDIEAISENQKTLNSELVNTNKALSQVTARVDAKVENAVTAAERAEQLCKDINTKLDRLFRKSQLK